MGIKERFRGWANIAVVGLSNSGKTTFYRWLTDDPNRDHTDNTSTTGVSKRKMEVGGEKFRIVDTPGQEAFEKWWEKEVKQAEVVLFFVDVIDEKLYPEAKERFENIMKKVKSRKKNLILVLNKIDLLYPGDVDRETKISEKSAELLEFFDFDKQLKNDDSFLVQPISALTGENCDKLIKMIYHTTTGNYLDTRLTVDNMVIIDKGGIVLFHKGSLKNLHTKFEGALAQIITKGIDLMSGASDPLFTITHGERFIAYYSTEHFYLVLVVDIRLDTKRATTLIRDTAEYLIRTKWIELDEEQRKNKINALLKEQIALTSTE